MQCGISLLRGRLAAAHTRREAGGAGKTTLAVRAARDVEACFSGGVVFVALGTVTDAETATREIAQALNCDRRPAGLSWTRCWIGVRAAIDRPDAAASTTSSSWSPSGRFSSRRSRRPGRWYMLLTSRRAPACVRRSHLHSVAHCSCPCDSDRESIDALSQNAAVRLFVQRAVRAIDLSFALDRGERVGRGEGLRPARRAAAGTPASRLRDSAC